ncbi:MAG: SET domain-containing protein-lysine N-methyltransferase [Myxococcales bacterium]|nr:SET domain-containing protein-lysine N-methyltransferase [Myxococcales bacterium]
MNATTKTTKLKTSTTTPLCKARRSPIHGTGVFAVRAIPQGARVIEYVGERISHREADRRYAVKDHDDNHTFLFTVDARTVIDAGVRGNDARFINHSCDPNCESIVEKGRVFIESIRPIAKGEELAYDYLIGRTPDDPPDAESIFACRCGAPKCRGTMLAPKSEKKGAKRKAPPKKKAKKPAAAPQKRRSAGTSARRAAKRPSR